MRGLQEKVGQPLSLAALGITAGQLEAEMDLLIANAMNDSQTVMSTRIPDGDDLRRLFNAALRGESVDF